MQMIPALYRLIFSDIPFIFEQFCKYKTATGCSLNKNKTEGLLIQTNSLLQ